ncbi:uncharacterized protein LOC103870193 [Brassica rapa]|uniref:DUF4408 domain-containing protein n=1 Tax=Brassica campestris TaxID=3711 RepID=A0A3P5YY56_BRACM|nr:uncharacterized protein LOC103870193 [Brassica rapa]CAG7877719.1 unnamed protein product [Brassica rapa]VDC72727.1 unnamed protein product [Brassica rapa]
MDRIKPELMKKLTKFIVISIWVSSLLITHNFYLCKLTIQLVTHAVDKMYMFLVCNGLLVFVAKYSGLISSSKPVEESWSSTDQTFDHRDFDSYDATLELEYYSDDHDRETKTFLAEEVSTQDQETEEEKEDEDEESDEPLPNNGDLEEECDIRAESREEEDNVGMVTEEDINKKFDEFIRKMKEELRLEAKQHLILV